MKTVLMFLKLMVATTFLLFPGHSSGSEDWFEKGLSLSQSNRYQEAISAFSKAIEINPHNTDAYINRGVVWFHQGDCGRALADYTKALNLDPRSVEANNNMAWILAVCPYPEYRNGATAVAMAEKATERNPEAETLDTLAAAYAEAGRFEIAMAIQKIVIALKTKEGGTEELAEYRKRLNLYRTAQPWREHARASLRGGTIRVRVGRVREKPSLAARITFRLKQGATPSIIEIRGDWCRIILKDGRTGWAHQSLFSEPQEAPTEKR